MCYLFWLAVIRSINASSSSLIGSISRRYLWYSSSFWINSSSYSSLIVLGGIPPLDGELPSFLAFGDILDGVSLSYSQFGKSNMFWSSKLVSVLKLSNILLFESSFLPYPHLSSFWTVSILRHRLMRSKRAD